MTNHFLTGEELDATRLTSILDRALALKEAPGGSNALADRTVALLFEQPSTRTRTSMEAGVVEMGGHPMVLRADELQLTRGESVRDTALVLSRHVAAIGLRTGDDGRLEELARYASVPVVNLLSPSHHPCQALADLMTLREAYGNIEGRRIAYVGDGNNVARSLAILGGLAGVEVAVAAPDEYQLEHGLGAQLTSDPAEAVEGADAVYTDVWVSMSDDEQQAAARREALGPYRLDDALLDKAAPARLRAPLPARPPGRGDHRGGALRRAPADLGPGREPAPRPEGAAGVPRFAGFHGRVEASPDREEENRPHATKQVVITRQGRRLDALEAGGAAQEHRDGGTEVRVGHGRGGAEVNAVAGLDARAAGPLPRPARGDRGHARAPSGGARRGGRARPHDP